MLLADIGNSRIHIYDGEIVEHLDYESAFKKYGDSDIFYISVQHRLKDRLKEFSRWVDISDRINLDGHILQWELIEKHFVYLMIVVYLLVLEGANYS